MKRFSAVILLACVLTSALAAPIDKSPISCPLTYTPINPNASFWQLIKLPSRNHWTLTQVFFLPKLNGNKEGFILCDYKQADGFEVPGFASRVPVHVKDPSHWHPVAGEFVCKADSQKASCHFYLAADSSTGSSSEPVLA